MKIIIDGLCCDLIENTSIIQYIRKLGLDSLKIGERPLAAMIGGEVFNLSYIPKHECSIQLLRYSDEEGLRIYERTLQFVLIIAIRKLFPEAHVIVQYSVGGGLFIKVKKSTMLSDSDTSRLKSEMMSISDSRLPLCRHRINIQDAIDFYLKDGQLDKAELLKWRKFNYFNIYTCPEYKLNDSDFSIPVENNINEYMDYFYGEMALDTGYVRVFDLHRIDDSLIMLLPNPADPESPAPYTCSPKLLNVFRESDCWGRLMTCATANELNRRVENGSIRELIRVNEALHEKNFSKIADDIIVRKVKAIMLAGPSSSGKTTSANRIATQLRVSGLDPVLLSLDDYYIDRELIPRDENGEMDLEHINTLDITRFNSDLKLLLSGQEAEIPRFSFLQGKREKQGRLLRLDNDQPLIIEGIHALNPSMLGDIDPHSVYRIYVSALTTLNLDDHNRIRTTDLRLLRRLVRDFNTRGASMEDTLNMWPSVRRGERTWIFPYQENADRIINTTLHYEVAVMKKYVYPLLSKIPKESPYYCQARTIVKFLNYFLGADVENEIPPTSILREFIGGNSFYN